MTPERRIDVVIAGLLAIDVALTACAFAAPGLWFTIFHGVPYEDPQGFLRRCGANWAAFALVEALALVRWRGAPGWLLVVAGVRLSDIFTDWAYLAFAADVTPAAWLLLGVSSPANVALGMWFLRLGTARREAEQL